MHKNVLTNIYYYHQMGPMCIWEWINASLYFIKINIKYLKKKIFC